MTRPLSRRSVLRGGLAMAAGTAATALVGCESGPSAQQLTAEALIPLVEAANADETAARMLTSAAPAYAAALAVIADQRAQHARALREEIIRLDQDVAARLDATTGAPATPADGSAAVSSTAPAPAPGPSTVAALRRQLAASAAQARDTAVGRTGYPAGLAGSVSASVASMVAVQLA